MCEIPEAVCSIKPRKGPWQLWKLCWQPARGCILRSHSLPRCMWRGGRKERCWPSVQELLQLAAEYLPELNGENLFCLRFTENVPQNSVSLRCPTFKKDDNFVFCLLVALSETTNTARMRVGIMFWMCNSLFFLRGFILWFNYCMTRVYLKKKKAI